MTAIRTILVPLTDSVADEALLKAAFTVGQPFNAHICALCVSPLLKERIPYVDEGMSAEAISKVLDESDKEKEEIVQKRIQIREMFDLIRSEQNIFITEKPPTVDRLTVNWSEAVGSEEDIIARRGRLFDLVMLRRPGGAQDVHSIPAVNAAVMNTGRPLLLMPPTVSKVIGRHIAIAWNGSPQAIRAVNAALPFLLRAQKITILTACESSDSVREDIIDAQEFAFYLAWHRLKTETLGFNAATSAVGEQLLLKVQECGADMLVMGAYTHGKLHNLIFGGVTRHMLEHLCIPVLMRH